MTFCTTLFKALDVLVAEQVTGPSLVLNADRTAMSTLHTVAATLTGTCTVMGTLLMFTLRWLAIFERMSAFLRSTLTTLIVSAGAWVASAAVNGTTSQSLD